jgi:NAD(P)-dependent dehydrogenase (short-subunit alcohol dehydrogenase family)
VTVKPIREPFCVGTVRDTTPAGRERAEQFAKLEIEDANQQREADGIGGDNDRVGLEEAVDNPQRDPGRQNQKHQTKVAVEKEGRRCILVSGDVADPEFCREAVARTVKQLGKLDVLVNNAAFQEHVMALRRAGLSPTRNPGHRAYGRTRVFLGD